MFGYHEGMTTYYVAFIAFDEESGVEISQTVECSEGGLLRLSPELRDIWANVDQKLQTESKKNAKKEPQTPQVPKYRPTRRPAKRLFGRKVS